MNVGIFKTLIGINELQLHNPGGFEDDIMMDLPEIYVDYNLGAFMGGKAHLEEVRLNLKEFLVVKNADGQLNLDSLRVVKETEGEEEKEVEKDDGKKEETKMPDLQIDLLEMKIGRVIYKDYSKGTPPKEKVFNVNIDERYENITDPKSFVRLIIVKALKNTTIANLTNFDLGKLQKGIAGTIKKTAEMALETPVKAIEAGKKTAEETVGKAAEAGKDAGEKVKEAAKGTVDKAADSLKKILPFGKDKN